MFKRQKTGSVICTSCGKLVGVQEPTCWNCGRSNPGLWGFATALRSIPKDLGFLSIVTWGCAALYIATLLVDTGGIRNSGINILMPSTRALFIFGASGAIPVFGYGRWWTVLSAAWLHGGVLHILFNLMWVRYLLPDVSELYGGSRLIIIYTVSSITGFLLSSWAGTLPGLPFFFRGAQLTLGASAPIFGLLGALVAYGRRGGSSHISSQAMTYAVIIFVFGFIMPGIDNFAHLGGFLGGYAIANALNPIRPEKLNHMIAAFLCLGLTAFSILASLLQGAFQ
jgi:rhomboid protease GluP